MILITYSCLFTDDIDRTLPTLERPHGRLDHLRFRLGDWDLTGVGDMFVVAGSAKSLATIRDSYGPVTVADLDAVQAELLVSGATITQPIVEVPTGRMLYGRHEDGLHIEYVEWTNELVERFIRAPQRRTSFVGTLTVTVWRPTLRADQTPMVGFGQGHRVRPVSQPPIPKGW